MPIDMLERLRTDPGHRTLGELLQERQWAVQEIERLRVGAEPSRAVRRGGVVAAADVEPRVKGPPTVPPPIAPVSPHQLLRMTAVTKMVGLSRSTIYKLIERGRFPAGVRIGVRARGWRMGDVVTWLERLSN